MALFDAVSGKHILEITYSGYADNAIIIETRKPGGERKAYLLERGGLVHLEDQISRDLLVIQYSGEHNRKNQATFCIFGARDKIKVFRRELLDRGEGSAKEQKNRDDISKN